MSIQTQLSAVQGHFGPFIVTYQTSLTPEELTELLGYDARELAKPSVKKKNVPDVVQQMHKEIQRRLSSPRCEAVLDYVLDRATPNARLVGAFPALSICFTNPCKFNPLSADDSLGHLVVPKPNENPRLIVDGFSRAVASLRAYHEKGVQVGRLPITIFAPSSKKGVLSLTDQGQLFVDFNKQVSVQSSHVLRLDRSNIYLNFTNDLAAMPTISEFHGIELGASKVKKRSHALLAQKQLLVFVRGVCDGARAQERSTYRGTNLTEDTYDDLLNKTETMLSLFAEEMGAAFADREKVHLTYVGFGGIGLIFHDLLFEVQADETTIHQVITSLARVNWDRSNRDWLGMLGSTGDKGRVSLHSTGRTTRSDLHKYLRDKSGITYIMNQKKSAAA